jgi:hypothetical protein
VSVRSELVRKAIFSKSNVGAVVGSGKLTAIYESTAPEGAALPYGIFFRQAPEPIQYAFGQTSILEGDIWTFKVLADEDASTSKEPQQLAEDLLAVWISTLGLTLTLSGATVAWMAPTGDMPPYQERQNNRYIYHRGTMVRIRTE